MSATDTQTLVDLEGKLYEAVRVFGPDIAGIERVIVKYEGLYTFAYRLPGEQRWQLETAESPRAPEEQEAALEELVRKSDSFDTTTVTVTKD